MTAESDKVKPRYLKLMSIKQILLLMKTILRVYRSTMQNEWMLKLLLINMNIKGIIGNPYKYTDGYEGIAVYQKVK